MLEKITLPVQKLLIGFNALQMGYLSVSYFNSTFANAFPVLDKLFKPEFSNTCTVSGCWQSIVPFLGSTYASIVLISLLMLFFRPCRELRLAIVGLASVHLIMATVRLTVVPGDFYQDGAAIQASMMQVVVGGLLVVSALLPYGEKGSG